MSRLNPVFTAITDIDDSIILNAKKSRKKPLAITLAASAVIVLAGFTIANRYSVKVNGKDAFDYHLTVQSITIPTHSEMEALGAVDQQKGECAYEWNTLPSAVFKTFGISPLVNDNFSEKECNNIIWANYTSDGTLANATFNYELTDKALDKTVKFRIFCMTKEGSGLITNLLVSETDKERMETIMLNDGSAGVIFEIFLGGLNIPASHADFSYNGIAYSRYLRDGTNEDTKQVLRDLGIL